LSIPSTGRILTLLAAFLLSVGWTIQSRAGGFTIVEFGAKKTSMMCSIAKPDDLSAAFHNPAGLANLHGTQFHLSSGFSIVDAGIKVRAWPAGEGQSGSEDYIDTAVDEDGYFEGTIKPTKYFGAMPMFAMSSDFGFDKGPVVSLSVYVPDFIGAFMPEDAPTRYFVTEAYFIAGMASASVGYRLPDPVDWISIGASLGVMYVRMEGKRWVNVPLYGDETTDYVLHMLGEDVQPFWNVGLTAEPIDGLVAGLVFIAGASVALDGSLGIDLPPGETEEDPVLLAVTDGHGLLGEYEQTTHMKVPSGLGAGLHWQVMDELDLAADFRWWFYHVFESQDMDHNIEQEVLGEPAVENPMVTPKDYHGSWTLSFGAAYRPFPDDWPVEFLAGWTYDKSPAPTRTKSLDAPTVDLTGISFGLRYTFEPSWRLSLGYYHYWYLKDEVTDSLLDPPQNAIFSGGVHTISAQVEFKL